MTVTSAPAFNIRKPPNVIYSLNDYAAAGIISDAQRRELQHAVFAHRNILIAGGRDKGFTFDPLRRLVEEKVRSTILIGEMAESIRRSWNGAVKSEVANSLADAVERAHASARPGEVVLFSPGTSSFDMFKSYADRGDQFRALVRALPAAASRRDAGAALPQTKR